MLPNIGSSEIIVILLVLIVLFGTQKMGELARGLGQTTKELKKAKEAYEKELNSDDSPEPKEKVKESAQDGA